MGFSVAKLLNSSEVDKAELNGVIKKYVLENEDVTDEDDFEFRQNEYNRRTGGGRGLYGKGSADRTIADDDDDD